MMQFSAKCTIIIQGSCYLHSRTWCIFPSFKQFLDQNIERERFTYYVLESISLMHIMFLQSVEVAQDAGWMHLLAFIFTSPVRNLEKCENILGTVLLLNLGKNFIYIYIPYLPVHLCSNTAAFMPLPNHEAIFIKHLPKMSLPCSQ